MEFLIALSVLSCNFSFGDKDSSGTMEIRYTDARQAIDGFGGSNAWTGLPSGAAGNAVVSLLYSRTEGAGFTILRNRIPFRERHQNDDGSEYDDGFINRNSDDTYKYTEAAGVKTFSLNWNSWELGNTKTLISRILALDADGPENLTLLSTPWTPPNNRNTNWKTGVPDLSKPDVGGRLDPARYTDYADLLADYAKGFESNMGASLGVLSIQNEPSWAPDYESCLWNGAEIAAFLKVLGQRFNAKGVAVGVMAPEDENFREDLITASLNDSAASQILTHVGVHQYEGVYTSASNMGCKVLPNVARSGKRLWQTEISSSSSNNSNRVPPGDMEDALYFAKMLHLDMTLAETSAFLFWWLWKSGPDNKGSLISVNWDGSIFAAARLYALGQYSRFVRPGWQRIGSTTAPASGVYSSAYKNPGSREIALALINDGLGTAEIALNLRGAPGFSGLEAWRTSETEKLQKVSGALNASKEGAVIVTLPPCSITTLCGLVAE